MGPRFLSCMSFASAPECELFMKRITCALFVDKIKMLKKDSPKQIKDEVVLQIYTHQDNVENVNRQLDALCAEATTDTHRHSGDS